MPKILFLADGLSMGGLERQLTLLVKYLPAPWTSRVIAFNGGIYAQKMAELGINPTILKRRTRYDIKTFCKFWNILRKERPDILHSWSWMSSLIAAPTCKLLGIRFVNGCIRSGSAPKRIPIRYKIVFSLSDRIIANSHAGLSAWRISCKKGTVIYNAIDPHRINLIETSNVKTDKKAITVVMAARMAIEKNFMMFINGAREISRIEPGRWKFIALGDGQNKAGLIDYSSDLIASGMLEFPGVTDEVIPYLLQSDIGVLLTNDRVHKEGLSNTIIEYMACRLPVICQENGGNRELVVPGVTGFLIEADDVDEFVRKLLWLAHHPIEAGQMGEAGRERIINLCSLERMVDEYIAIYQDVLKRND